MAVGPQKYMKKFKAWRNKRITVQELTEQTSHMSPSKEF